MLRLTPSTNEDGYFRAVAKQQIAELPDRVQPSGGRILLAKLTKDEVSIRDLGEI